MLTYVNVKVHHICLYIYFLVSVSSRAITEHNVFRSSVMMAGCK